jgi:hypothetical protein
MPPSPPPGPPPRPGQPQGESVRPTFDTQAPPLVTPPPADVSGASLHLEPGAEPAPQEPAEPVLSPAQQEYLAAREAWQEDRRAISGGLRAGGPDPRDPEAVRVRFDACRGKRNAAVRAWLCLTSKERDGFVSPFQCQWDPMVPRHKRTNKSAAESQGAGEADGFEYSQRDYLGVLTNLDNSRREIERLAARSKKAAEVLAGLVQAGSDLKQALEDYDPPSKEEVTAAIADYRADRNLALVIWNKLKPGRRKGLQPPSANC